MIHGLEAHATSIQRLHAIALGKAIAALTERPV
jgi:hypothetical protein